MALETGPAFHSLVGHLSSQRSYQYPVRCQRRRQDSWERSRPDSASRKSRGRWSVWSIQAAAGWASGHACAPAWKPGWGSQHCTEGSDREQPHVSSGAWSWQRNPGSAEDRGYRRRASLLQVEKAREGRNGRRLAKLGVRQAMGQGRSWQTSDGSKKDKFTQSIPVWTR